MKTEITLTCANCGKTVSVMLDPEDLYSYNIGRGPIMKCFPYLNADEREIMQSGLCGKCFEKLCIDKNES